MHFGHHPHCMQSHWLPQIWFDQVFIREMSACVCSFPLLQCQHRMLNLQMPSPATLQACSTAVAWSP